MSLRHGLLDLLAGEPRSGYDLARYFAASMNNVWPAQHSQIYPELARLAKEGLIAQVGEEGPRRRKTYRTTEAGVEELRRWLREEQPDYSVRYPARLRTFALWVLPTDEALAQVATERAEYARRLAFIEGALVRRDWGADPTVRAGRIAIEFGRRFYAFQIEWADWAAQQIASGTLQRGNPPPNVDAPAPTTRSA